jgi:hypothetical protein
MAKNWKFILGVVISAIALWFTLKDISFTAFVDALRNANWIWFLPAAALFIVGLFVRAWRWSVIMGGAPILTTYHAQNIGYMMNMIFPGRLGEIGRAYVIGEKTPINMTRAVSSVVVERLLDLAAVVLMLVVAAQFIPMPSTLSRYALISGAIVAAGVVAIGVMIWQSALVENLLSRWLGARAEKWVRRFRELCAGFKLIGTPQRLLAILLLTIGIWLMQMIIAYTFMPAFLPARFDASSLMVVVANLGGAVPTPGGVGPAQAFAQTALVVPFGLDKDRATAFVFVWWFSQLLALILLGFIGLFRVGLSIRQLTRRSR